MAFKLTIDATLTKIITTLNLMKSTNDRGKLKNLNSEVVFTTLVELTPKILYGLLAEDPKNKIMINLQVYDWSRDEEWVEYDPLQHGCIPLGNFHGANTPITILDEDTGSHRLDTAIKFPEGSMDVILGRTDVDSRRGRIHPIDLKQLVHREPANGKAYHCTLMIPPNIEFRSSARINI